MFKFTKKTDSLSLDGANLYIDHSHKTSEIKNLLNCTLRTNNSKPNLIIYKISEDLKRLLTSMFPRRFKQSELQTARRSIEEGSS